MNVATIGDTTLSSEQLVSWLKLSGRFPSVVHDLLQEKLAAQMARQQGLTVSDDDLQQAVENHRRVHGLYRVVDANEFLDAAGASLDDYETFIEDGLLAERMLSEVASDAAIEAHFEANKPDYESVDIGHIVVDSDGKAREVMALVADGDATFEDMAREVSQVETAASGGRIGTIFRGMLNEDLEAQLFAAQANDVLGPIELGDGNVELFSVFERRGAELTDETRETIRQRLASEWLHTTAHDLGVEV